MAFCLLCYTPILLLFVTILIKIWLDICVISRKINNNKIIMNNQEKDEIEFEIRLLKQILDFHNEFEMKLGMDYEQSIEHRLDIMEQIAELQNKLK
jgi:hypothetical protein